MNVRVCDGNETNLPILFRTQTGSPTDRDRPCQSRNLLYCLDILCHSVSYEIKTSQHIPSILLFYVHYMLGYIYIHCVYIGIKPLDDFFSI